MTHITTDQDEKHSNGDFCSNCFDGGCSSVVRESEFKSEDPGLDPPAGQGEKQLFCPSKSTLVQTCA